MGGNDSQCSKENNPMPTNSKRQNTSTRTTRTLTKSDTANGVRSHISAQNLMEGDEFVMRGEPNIFVESVRRNEEKGTVSVTFSNGMKRRYEWNSKALIMEYPERHAYRRNSLRRNGYKNYLKVLAARATA